MEELVRAYLFCSVEGLEVLVEVLAFDSTARQRRGPQLDGIGCDVEVLDAVAERDHDAQAEEEDEPGTVGAPCAPGFERALQVGVGVGAETLDERGRRLALARHLLAGGRRDVSVDVRHTFSSKQSVVVHPTSERFRGYSFKSRMTT